MNEQFLDPVCGMTVDSATAAGTSTIGETIVYFCSTYCKARFDADPDAFVTQAEQPAGCGRCCR